MFTKLTARKKFDIAAVVICLVPSLVALTHEFVDHRLSVASFLAVALPTLAVVALVARLPRVASQTVAILACASAFVATAWVNSIFILVTFFFGFEAETALLGGSVLASLVGLLAALSGPSRQAVAK